MDKISNSGPAQSMARNRPTNASVADVLAVLHGEKDAYPAAAYAVGLAEMLGAHLTIAGITRDPARQFYLAQAPAPALAAALDAARTSANAFASKVAVMAAERGLSSQALTLEIQIGQGWSEASRLARLYDISVLARPAGEDAARDQALLETVLMQSGRAVLVVPPSYAGPVSFARPVFAWDASRSAARALAEAIPILRHAGEAQVVTVVGQNDAKAAVPDIIPHIERHGIACTHYEPTLSGSIAQTLLAHAQRAASDLLVMGAFGHSRIRELVLGGTTHDVLLDAGLPVLLAF